jgi:hypothetical protein
MIHTNRAATEIKIPLMESIDRNQNAPSDAFAAALERRQRAPAPDRAASDRAASDRAADRDEPLRDDAPEARDELAPRERPDAAIAAVAAPIDARDLATREPSGGTHDNTPEAAAPPLPSGALAQTTPNALATPAAPATAAPATAAPAAPALTALTHTHTAQPARPAPHLHEPRLLDLPEGAQLSWGPQAPAAPAQQTAAVEASALQIWMARALQPNAEAAPITAAPLPLDLQLPTPAPLTAPPLAAQAAANALPQPNADLSSQGEPGQSGHPHQSPLGHSAAAADVQGGPQGQPVADHKAQAASRAINESLRLQSEEGGGGVARLEVQVGDERLVIQVRVKGGHVDVDVRGMDPAELARLREELEPELARQRLSLGALRQEGAGDGAEQRRTPPQEAAPTEEGVTVAPARRPAAPRIADSPRTAEAGLHLEA